MVVYRPNWNESTVINDFSSIWMHNSLFSEKPCFPSCFPMTTETTKTNTSFVTNCIPPTNSPCTLLLQLYFRDVYFTWWRHQMEIFSALLAICTGNSPIPGDFPAQRPVTRSFDVFFDLRLNKRLSKQSWAWWFETPSCPLWRHCNELMVRFPGTPSLKITWVPKRGSNFHAWVKNTDKKSSFSENS